MPTFVGRANFQCSHCRYLYASELQKKSGRVEDSRAWQLASVCEQSVLVPELVRYEPKLLIPSDARKLGEIPDDYVSLVIADPPYAISEQQTISRGRNTMKFKGSDLNLHKGAWDDQDWWKELTPATLAWCSEFRDKLLSHGVRIGEDENKEIGFWGFTHDWIKEADRVLHPGGCIVCFYDRGRTSIVNLILEWGFGYKTKGSFGMMKNAPTPQARKQKWANGWEMAVIAMKPIPAEMAGCKEQLFRYNWKEGHCGDWGVGGKATSWERFAAPEIKNGDGTVEAERAPGHSTAKPTWAYKRAIRWWSFPGDVVLELFSGSAPGAECGYLLGRKMMCVDNDDLWYGAAVTKIEDAKAYLRCNGIEPEAASW